MGARARRAACVAAFALLPWSGAGRALPAPLATLIPTTPGASFAYGGEACRAPAHGERRDCSRVRWTMRVLASWQRNERTAAVVSGFVTDLAWYRPGTKPAVTVLLQTPTGLYLQPVQEGQNATAIAQHALADGHLWQQLAALPLHPGSCVGSVPPRSSDPRDAPSCWRAEQDADATDAWRLERQGTQDTEAITFDPGRGIIAYRYDHAGEAVSTHVHLLARTPSPVPPAAK